jgi:hypothetical protein
MSYVIAGGQSEGELLSQGSQLRVHEANGVGDGLSVLGSKEQLIEFMYLVDLSDS